MTAGAAFGADDLEAGLHDALRCAEDFVDEIKRGIKAMVGGGESHEKSHAHPGPPPWERRFGGHKGGPGHWGGGFVGMRGGWFPGFPFPGPPGPQAPPGPPRGPKASRGDVRAAILALLREGPRNGYQIMSDIEERSGGAWRPSPGAVYPALSQLADEGLIASEESAGRRAFSLTDAGREYVEQNPDMARGAWESSAQQEAWQIPGLFAEAARLGSGIVQIVHAGTPDQIRQAERLLERTRRELYRILAEDSEEADDPGEDEDEQEI